MAQNNNTHLSCNHVQFEEILKYISQYVSLSILSTNQRETKYKQVKNENKREQSF